MRKLFKNAIKIFYSKRQCVSASGGLRPQPSTGTLPLDPAGGRKNPLGLKK